MKGVGSHSSTSALRHHAAAAPRSDVRPRKTCKALATAVTAKTATKQVSPDIETVVPSPVVSNFPVPTDLGQFIDRPEVARATITVDKEHPKGVNWQDKVKLNRDPLGRTVLQQHVDFFDHDGDGIIWPSDTAKGLRDIGTNPILSIPAALYIHMVSSWMSMPGWRLTCLLFPIYTDNILKTRHGSDSLVYDYEGRFQPVKFEEIFTKFDKGGKLGLTQDELMGMVRHNKQMLDNFGSFVSWSEWSLAFSLFSEPVPDPANPSQTIQVFPKDRIRGIYDGSIFYLTALRRQQSDEKKGAKQK